MAGIRPEIAKRCGRFSDSVRTLSGSYFGADEPIMGSRAPGRLDVMGGIADYSGSLVLELPLECAAYCAVQRQSDPSVSVRSANAESQGYRPQVSAHRDAADAIGQLPPDGSWAAYVLGCVPILEQEGLLPRDGGGYRFYVESDVPIGAGVSSSAAIEVASMMALATLAGARVDGMQLARMCQRVENEIAGSPCGIMDQATSALGEENRLLALDCRPHTIIGQVDIPADWRFVGLNSGVKHRVGGGRYTQARASAFMGLRILDKEIGLLPGGYLANLSAVEWGVWRDHVPELIRGRDFLERFGKHVDPATTVDPDTAYFPRSAAEHPILENGRVRQFMELLGNAANDERAAREAGLLMLQSHRSYSARVHLGSGETDLLVRLAMQQGPENGLYGAKITGGGSGGTVAVLCRGDAADAAIESVRSEYAARTGIAPDLLTGSSPGALAFGAKTIPR